MVKIGFGGGCHWCTEAVFQAVKGVLKVDQGWISSEHAHEVFSEGVVVYFDAQKVSLKQLIRIHLHTHSSTSNHSLRSKYRSAIYYFNASQRETSSRYLIDLQKEFNLRLITKTLPFRSFKQNEETFLNYYLRNTNKPFCKRFIEPKLKVASSLEKINPK